MEEPNITRRERVFGESERDFANYEEDNGHARWKKHGRSLRNMKKLTVFRQLGTVFPCFWGSLLFIGPIIVESTAVIECPFFQVSRPTMLTFPSRLE